MNREAPLTSSVVDVARLYARQRVAKLDSDEVLETLRAQGIGSLEELVAEMIQSAGRDLGVGSKGLLEPWELFCFDWYMYRRPPMGGIQELVQPEVLEGLDELEGRISRAGGGLR